MEVQVPTTTDVMLWHCTQSLGEIRCGLYGRIYTDIHTLHLVQKMVATLDWSCPLLRAAAVI